MAEKEMELRNRLGLTLPGTQTPRELTKEGND